MRNFHQFLALLFGGWFLVFITALVFYPQANFLVVNLIGIVVGLLFSWLSPDMSLGDEEE